MPTVSKKEGVTPLTSMLSRHWRGLVTALIVAVVWWILAARTPSSTFHFAPSVLAAAWVVVEASGAIGVTRATAVRLSIAGFVFAAAETLLLEAATLLEGPIFWDHGDEAPVVLEHLLFAALGAVVGVVGALRATAGRPVPEPS